MFAILKQNYDKFFVKIPASVKNSIFDPPLLERHEEIAKFAQDSYVILSESVEKLLSDFISIKKKGTLLERTVYEHIATPADLVDRLMQKRPLVFMGSQDSYLLRDGKAGDGGFDHLESKDPHDGPIHLPEYISYDEMLVSALLGVSVRTHFINR